MKGYSFQNYDSKKMARAKANYAPISMKTTYEVLRLIRGRNLDQAVTMLGEVKEAKRPVAFLKYRKDVPHRKGDGLSIGRFPRKVSIELIELLTLVKANAKEKGLKEDALIIIHAAVNSGPNLWHYGRIRRRRRKSCHVEVVVQEKEQKKKEVKKK